MICRPPCFVSFFILLAVYPLSAAEPGVTLTNDHIQVELRPRGGVWKNYRLARLDGSDGSDSSDTVTLDSDEFEILLFDGTRFTVDDYAAAGPPVIKKGRSITIRYVPKPGAKPSAPKAVTVTYELGDGPHVYKTVALEMNKGDKIDRLQVWRFSTAEKASRGGHAQPVFVGNWFFGVDYPGFYSRHSDGFTEPAFNYRWYYDIDLDGKDQDLAPRKGLVTLFHFPGFATEQPDGTWGIRSKRAVAGLSRTKGENAELALLDYITATRKKPRSHLHFNNWYSPEAKSLTIEAFVDGAYRPIAKQLAKYDLKLDAMVADHGWENSKSFRRIFEPRIDEKHQPLPQVARALEKAGTKFGAWIAFDGTNQDLEQGEKVGYRPAYAEGFERDRRWMQLKPYFDLLQPKYLADLRESIRFLIEDAGADYIKHDLNHNFTTHYMTERHAREKCLDTTLDLLAYERQLRPGIYQNYTNGSWFTPWWLQHVDAIWMMSGDSGGGDATWPRLSLRDAATTYRDRHFFEGFNNPERCPRPLIPIANFMTHGILFARQKPFTDFRDTLHDWSDYVVMYYARGTMVKELYITPEMLDDDHWKVLGMATRWAVRNQDRLVNTLFIGGNPAGGQVYGFISWVDGRALLTVRNPDRRRQTLRVPFDMSVYYRGKPDQPYHARAIYPFVEAMPWKLASGREFAIDVPGDSVQVFEIEPGEASAAKANRPEPLPEFKAECRESSFHLTLKIPDEELTRYDLVVEPWAHVFPEVRIDGKPVEASRFQVGKRWTIAAYDLRPYRGREITVDGHLVAASKTKLRKDRKVATEVWLVADRKLSAPSPKAPSPKQDPALPFSIGQGYRRQTQPLVPKTPIKAERTDDTTPLAKHLEQISQGKKK